MQSATFIFTKYLVLLLASSLNFYFHKVPCPIVGAYEICFLTGYLACARCSSTGSLVLIEPVSTYNGGDQPLSPPKTERCSNCLGAGKVRS